MAKSHWRSVLFPVVIAGVCIFSSFFIAAHPARATNTRPPDVRVFEVRRSGATQQQNTFTAFDAASTSGGTIAVGDVNGDGTPETVVAAGNGSQPYVRVFSLTGEQLASFLAYDPSMTSGVNVAVGDLNNDGTAEIVTGTGDGAGPQVRVFDMHGNTVFTTGFFAYDSGFRGGVNVAVGNVTGKRGAEIITGAGPGGGPQVRVFNKRGRALGLDFFPFAQSDHGGVSVAVANVDGGARSEIITALHSYGQPWIKVYKTDAAKTILGNFLAYSDSFYGGVNVAGADVDGDGNDEVVTSVANAGGPQVRAFEPTGAATGVSFMAYEDDFRGGVSVAAANMDDDAKTEIVTMPRKKIAEGRTDLYKYIDVDLSEQTLRAYQNGYIENEFLVSTGVARYPTPTGQTTVTAKLLSHDYEWSYGADHPDNYDLPDVPYNLRFRPTYYIHNAYWHNNFGHRMSHGCVNVNLENSRWIYEWADVGTTVIVHE